MAISRSKKKEILEKLEPIVRSQSVVFLNFHGLSAGDTNVLRKSLKSKKVGLIIAKKTLVRKVLGEAMIPGTMPELEGELALAYGDDMIVPANEAYAFQKKFDNKISILGGIFEGKYASKEEMMVVAQIPPRETLYAQFVNLVNSPIQGFVMAINEITKKKA